MTELLPGTLSLTKWLQTVTLYINTFFSHSSAGYAETLC